MNIKKMLGDSAKPLKNGSYKPPTGEQVTMLIEYSGMSVKDICNLTGASYRESSYDSGTVRSWQRGRAKIPYSSWMLLLLKSEVLTLEDL